MIICEKIVNKCYYSTKKKKENKNLLNGHFLREKNSKSESNSEIYKFRSALFESSALKKCYVEFVK